MLKLGDRAVAGRYARALFDVAQKAGKAEAVRAELAELQAQLRATPALAAALAHPQVPGPVKAELAGKALGKPSPVLIRFLELMFEKKRLDGLDDVIRRYADLADAAQGVTAVDVRTAVPLEPAQKERLQKALEKKLGKVRVSAAVDPTLLGGVYVQAGDRVWDGTIAEGLARLKEDLLAAARN